MYIIPDSYKPIIKNDEIIETSIIIQNLPVALVNSLRRILISNIPTATLNDIWNNREELRFINVIKNTSSLHNEFINHRLSLIPLTMNDNLKILSKFDSNFLSRNYKFKNPDIVPKFQIKMKNDKKTRSEKNVTEFIEITTNDLKVVESENPEITMPSIESFIKPDPFTNEYIILNILKPNILNDDEGEEIDIIAKPSPGIGLENSRFSPVGQFYSFVVNLLK